MAEIAIDHSSTDSDPIPEVQVAQIIQCTQAEGPGKRFALWVQGCPLRCPGCCNPEMLSFDGGQAVSVDDLIQQIQDALPEIEGVTFIGGEPFAHAASLSVLAKAAQQLKLSVMVFTGFQLEHLQAVSETNSDTANFLRHIDLLIDGPYDSSAPDTSRRWIGSTNQRAHFLTDRYSAADAAWSTPDTLEVRWNGTELLVNGFPATSAADLWKRRENS